MARGEGNSASRDALKLKLAKRDAEVMRLRTLGHSQNAIAEMMGLKDGSHVSKIIRKVIAAIPAEDAELVRKLECERLDMLLLPHLKKGTKGDVQSAGVVLKLMERRAQYSGLDMPRSLTIELTRQATQTLDNLSEALARGEITPQEYERFLAIYSGEIGQGAIAQVPPRTGDDGDSGSGDGEPGPMG
jgi:hypothetical protein